MPVDQNWILDRLLLLVPLILSLSVHEWAHARAAWQLGDDTAARLGRLTLDPLAHIDPLGTILLPLLGVPFGWAKPVPVQPYNFHSRVGVRKGMMLTAAAGPVANLCLAAIFIVLFAVLIRFWPDLLVQPGQGLMRVLLTFISLNVVLAAFNMLPIPPLDGSRIADWLMPRSLRPAWEAFGQAAPFALAVVIILPMLAGVNFFAWPLEAATHVLVGLVRLLGG